MPKVHLPVAVALGGFGALVSQPRCPCRLPKRKTFER